MDILLVCLAACAVACYILISGRRRRARLPPGPPSLPILGALFSLPKVRPWMTFRNWSEEYGSDMLFLDIPNQPTIVLNSYKVVYDLLEKRSRNYSDRAVRPSDQLTGWDFAVSLMPYGARWRETRRTFHQYFNQEAVKRDHHEIITREIRLFLQRASQSSDEARLDLAVVGRTFAGVILDVMYGMKVEDERHQLITLSQKAVDILNETRTQVFWIDYFPWLCYIPAWIPGPHRNAVKFADKNAPTVSATRRWGFDIAARDFAAGTASPSMSLKLLQQLDDRYAGTKMYEDQKNVAIDATGIAYAAAVDTQTSTVSAFLIGMAMNTDIQKKAQQEVDAVVGPHRLPTMDDIENLPYVQAILMESLRWMPVLPLNLQHDVLEDDDYEGYMIPRGFSMIVNTWAVLRDPVAHPDPDIFNPGRFIRDGAIDPDVRKPTLAFGVGRRICAGRHYATDSLSLLLASILYLFDIESVLSEGEELTSDSQTSLVTQPERVPCRLRPRDVARLALLQDSKAV